MEGDCWEAQVRQSDVGSAVGCMPSPRASASDGRRRALGMGFVVAIADRAAGDALREAYVETQRLKLEAVGSNFAEGFEPADLRRPDLLLEKLEGLLARRPELRRAKVVWRDDRLRVVSTDPRSDGRSESNRELYVSGTAGVVFDETQEGGEPVLALSRPLREAPGGRAVAALELERGIGSFVGWQDQRREQFILITAAGGLLLAIGLVLFLTRSVVRPLDRVRAAAGGLGEGDLSQRLGWRRSDVIGDLARDFDRMAADLERADADQERTKRRLVALADRDPVTGLLNHRAFHERLEAEVSRARRAEVELAVVVIDLDSFKAVNDRYGHAVGDEALRALATAIRSSDRSDDVLGRIGGDEFALSLYGTGADGAEGVVERIRDALLDHRIGERFKGLGMSAGIAEFPAGATSVGELLRLADRAMYWAKLAGGNRSVVHSPELSTRQSSATAVEQAQRAGLVNTIRALAGAVDATDGHTHEHSKRVAAYATVLAEHLGLSIDHVEQIRTAATLHDVGKIGVPNAILLKPGALTDEEYTVLKRHSDLGAELIAGAGMPELGRWVLHVHERYDGKGYPAGSARERIPFESRVLAVADALEAMTDARIYGKARSIEEALAELDRCAGTQFDPEITRVADELVSSGDLVLERDVWTEGASRADGVVVLPSSRRSAA